VPSIQIPAFWKDLATSGGVTVLTNELATIDMCRDRLEQKLRRFAFARSRVVKEKLSKSSVSLADVTPVFLKSAAECAATTALPVLRPSRSTIGRS
jgi:hypothetical protein